jgi:putative lipase involved disintegration of autophagic bodies
MLAATSINLRENGASQAQVDQWIDDLWQNRDVMTPGAASFSGSNAAPSGTYQDATPPTTGKEKAYDLVENYGWSLAITS